MNLGGLRGKAFGCGGRFCGNLRVGLAVATAAILAACIGISRRAKPLVPELSKPRAVIAVPNPNPKVRIVELSAHARGNIVAVTVINLQPKKILVGPKMFGVIVQHKLYTADSPNVISRFPVKVLGLDDGVTGVFRFRNLGSLVGQKLVLNCPDAGKFVVRIEGDEKPTTQPAVRRPTQPGQPSSRPEVEEIRRRMIEEMQKTNRR